MLLHGWRATDDQTMKPFQQRRDELSVQDACILWRSRVVIPPPGRPKVIDELHAGHPRMKGLARSYVWWPGMDADIERIANCANRIRNPHQLYQCRHGNGQPNLGQKSTLTMLDQFKENALGCS